VVLGDLDWTARPGASVRLVRGTLTGRERSLQEIPDERHNLYRRAGRSGSNNSVFSWPPVTCWRIHWLDIATVYLGRFHRLQLPKRFTLVPSGELRGADDVASTGTASGGTLWRKLQGPR
jgi:hypothetical protein